MTASAPPLPQPSLAPKLRTIPVLLWPLLALALILLLNLGLNPTFFHFTIRDGRIYGSIIDILDRASPTILVSLGMTLVIATAGVDLSVGAVMAIAGSIAAVHINSGHTFVAAAIIALGIALAAGAWNGLLVSAFEIQPIVATL